MQCDPHWMSGKGPGINALVEPACSRNEHVARSIITLVEIARALVFGGTTAVRDSANIAAQVLSKLLF